MAGDIEENIPLNNLNETEKYREIFKNCDTNRDGKICVRELDAFINSHSSSCQIIPRKCIRSIHKMADSDGDKQLDYDEFVYLITHEKLQHLFERYMSSYCQFLIPPNKDVEAVRPFGLRSVPIDGRAGAKDAQMSDEITCCPPPIFLFLISILEFAFYLTDELNESGSTLSGSGLTAQIFIYEPRKRYEVWRFLTYIFVHIGYTHLCVNLAVQLVLGVPLEMVHRWWRVLIIYFSGGIAGSLAHSIADPRIRLGGASGGVYALLTAHIANVIMNWGQMTYPIIQLFMFGLLISVDMGTAIYERFILNQVSNVGVAAHTGGAIAGLLVGIYTLRNLKITNTEKYIWWIALVLYVILMTSAIFINIFAPSHFA